MKGISRFIFSEKKLAGVILGVLTVATFSFVFGPNIYAQFSRQTGSEGWGYGYGYGYGYGGGWDGGAIAGYRTGGDADANVTEYEYGMGYIDTGVTYDGTNGYQIGPTNLANLVQSGLIVVNGGDLTSATVINFPEEITLTVASGITVNIPAGTTFTTATAGDFSALAASANISTTDLTNGTVLSSLSFGLPVLGLTVDPAITIAVNVGATYEGHVLSIYRKDATGAWVNGASGTSAICTVTAGICTFTTTHLSSFATVSNATGVAGGRVAVPGSGGGYYTPPASASTDSTATGTYTAAAALGNTLDINTDMGLTAPPTGTTVYCTAGTLIKGSLSAVYYCGRDGKRYVFTNDKAYFSWYADFSGVSTISDTDLAKITLGGNVTYRPGAKMIKVQSDPKVYAISRGGLLRWVSTEAIATRLYGSNWNTMIDDVSDAFFVNYTVGTSISQ